MARYKSYSNPREPQRACSGTKERGIINAISTLREKQVRLAKQKFDYHELLHLFVEPEHHAHLRYSYDLIEPSGLTNELYVKTDVPAHLEQHTGAGDACYMKFMWYGKKEGGFHVPYEQGSEKRKWAHVLHQHAPTGFVEKYVQVEQDLLDIQCRFALVERVFRNLNQLNVCKTLPQIRYVWPCISILLNRAGYTEDAKALAEPSLRAGDKVILGDWLNNHVKETNDTVVRALMLDDVQMPADNLDPDYDLIDTFRTMP